MPGPPPSPDSRSASLPLVALGAVLAVTLAGASLLAGTQRPARALSGDLPVTWTGIGKSVQHRTIRAMSFGGGPLRVLVVGGVHGDECGAGVAESFARWLVFHPEAVPEGTRIDVIACMDPDGQARGSRFNARGVDLNRNFPSRDWRRTGGVPSREGKAAGSEPETKAVVRYLRRGYSRVVTLHSRGPLMDFDGPGAASLAATMAAAARIPVGHVPRESSIHGSMGRYVPERYGIPLITWELTSRVMTPKVLRGLLAACR